MNELDDLPMEQHDRAVCIANNADRSFYCSAIIERGGEFPPNHNTLYQASILYGKSRSLINERLLLVLKAKNGLEIFKVEAGKVAP